MICAVLAIVSLSLDGPPTPKVKIAVSKETTYLTAPLRADGLVDFVGAANAPLGAIDPKDNAVVLLIKAFGPKVLSQKGRAEYLRLLRCEEPPKEGEYFVEMEDLWKRKRKNEDDFPYEEYGKCSSAPWKAAEHPFFAELLQVNAKPLQLIVEASKCKILATPVPAALDPPIMTPPSFGSDVIGELRAAVRHLTLRCMLRVGDGDLNGAFADIDACHRLGSLVGEAARTSLDVLLAGAIRGSAYAREHQIMQSGMSSAEQSRARANLAASANPTVDVRRCTTHWDRMFFLDFFIAFNVYDDLPDAEKPKSKKAEPKRPTPTAKEMDDALRMANEFYDGLAKCFDAATRTQRLEHLKRFENDLLGGGADNANDLLKQILENKNPPVNETQTPKQQVVAFRRLILPAAKMIEQTAVRNECRQRITVLAYSLAATKKESGRYPDRLDAKELGVPPAWLIDPSTDQPIEYRINDGRHWLVCGGEDGSINPNAVWNEERGVMETKGGSYVDDVVVRLP